MNMHNENNNANSHINSSHIITISLMLIKLIFFTARVRLKLFNNVGLHHNIIFFCVDNSESLLSKMIPSYYSTFRRMNKQKNIGLTKFIWSLKNLPFSFPTREFLTENTVTPLRTSTLLYRF